MRHPGHRDQSRCYKQLSTKERVKMNILFFLTPKADLAFIRTDTNVAKALKIMEQYRYTAVPMIDKEGIYKGVLTEGDMLYNLKNQYNFNLDLARSHSIMDLDIRRNYEPVRIGATVTDVYKKAMIQNFVPVVDDDGVFIGIVKRRDIIQYFYDQYIQPEEDHKAASGE